MPRIPTIIRDVTGAGQNVRTTKLPAYPRERTLDRQGDAVQDYAANATASSRADSLGAYVVFRDLVFSAGVARAIPHSLGRKYVGFRVERMRGTQPISIVELTQSVDLNKAQITLSPNTTCTVDVVVY